jgi:fatty acid desaturase
VEQRKETAAARLETERERATRRRRKSIMVGVTGIVLLFAAALGILALPGAVVPLLVMMIVGLALLIAAFVLAPSRMSLLLEKPKG